MCDLKDPELGFGYEGPQSLSEVRIAFYRRLFRLESSGRGGEEENERGEGGR